MKRSLKLYVVIAGIVVAVLFLIGSGLEDTMVYYVTVNELETQSQAHPGRGLRVGGVVVAGSLVHRAGTAVEFTLKDGEDELLVKYQGILPDTFKENREVLIEGKYLGSGVLQAEKIFTKCASKYEAAPEVEHPSDMPKEES